MHLHRRFDLSRIQTMLPDHEDDAYFLCSVSLQRFLLKTVCSSICCYCASELCPALAHAGPGKIPMHYFGTQEFAWMKRKDVVSFEAGLAKGMHVCKASNCSKSAFMRALHEVSIYFLVCADTQPALLASPFRS